MIVDVPGIPIRQSDGSVVYALIDPDLFAEFNEHRWYLTNGYAVRTVGKSPYRTLRMHREILGLAAGDPRLGDHINRIKLDNRRENLRIVTEAQNRQNQPARVGTSRFRGVHRTRNIARPWKAEVRIDGRKVSLGHFATEAAAGKAASDFRRIHMPYSFEDAA